MHQAFLLGALYELDRYGQITTRLFENLNTRLYRSSGAHKFVALLYGEVSEDGTFRFLSAGQPFPWVFSHRENRFVTVESDRRLSAPPIGIQPSLNVIDHSTNESPFGFMELYTDGLSEHADDRYFPGGVERVVREHKDHSAREIYEAIMADALGFDAPSDDMTLVVVKRE
jgi:serine phosphatase RsbU (regulator of sigma subunit)